MFVEISNIFAELDTKVLSSTQVYSIYKTFGSISLEFES